MKALVTGGAGFIGSHMVDRLLGEGYDVKVIDNLRCGTTKNVTQHIGSPRFEFVETDMTDQAGVLDAVKGCHVVFHFAAQATIQHSIDNHYGDLNENVYGMVNLLEAMNIHKVKNLVFSSSSAIYGAASVIPTPESYMPTQTSLYGASKISGEAFAQAFGEFSGTRTWAFRFANVVGERCRRGVIWNFVHKLLDNPKKLEILGDGKQSKEYVHVSDVVEGMLKAYKSGPPQSYNVGHPTQTTVDEVADTVIDEMGLTDVTKVHAGGKQGWTGDNPNCVLSIERLKSLGWSPKVSSDEAIRRTARWTLENPA